MTPSADGDATYLVFFERPDDESVGRFSTRLHHLAETIAGDPRARDVILFVADDAVGAPPEATAMPSNSDAMLLTTGVPSSDLPPGDAVYRTSRRVMKARNRSGNGARSAGFTVVCPSVRASTLSHDEFDAHWRDNHAPIHIASSPGTCHYEHLVVDETVTPGAAEWDGIGLLSFASADDYTERLFADPAAEEAIFTDVAKFLELQRGETIPTSEFVYRDSLA